MKTTAGESDRRPPLYVRKTTPSVDEDDSIVRELKNNFDKITKKTFPDSSAGVKKKIENFTQMTADSEKCLIGSGRCAKHNTRVQRVMKNKRVSVVNKDGSIGWKLCEFTVLECPAANSGASKVGGGGDSLSDERAGATTNKKQRILMRNVNDQSDLSPAMMYWN